MRRTPFFASILLTIACTGTNTRESIDAATSDASSTLRLIRARAPELRAFGVLGRDVGAHAGTWTSGPARVTLPSRADGAIRFDEGDRWVEISATDCHGTPRVEEGANVFINACPATDVAHAALPHGAEEVRILLSAEAPRTASYRLHGKDIDDVRVEGGRVVAFAGGKPFVRTDVPFAVDANGVRHEVRCAVARDGDAWIVRTSVEGELAYPVVVDPSWVSASELDGVEFADGAAVPLPDGRVFVFGGYDAVGNYLANSAFYRPTTNNWASTSSTTGRARHSLVWVPSIARVLLVGGVDEATGSTPVAELFDPVAGAWSAGGTMATGGGVAHYLSTIDRVLVVKASSELWTPSTKTFAAAGTMVKSRSNPITAVLPDGRVLAAGGSTSESTAEIWNPTTKTWTATASMSTARGDAIAITLGDGRVLVAGGTNGGTSLSSAEVFNGTTWSPAAPMLSAHSGHRAAMLTGGYVLVTGGSFGTGAVSAEIYDPYKNIWVATPPMIKPRTKHVIAPISGGRVLVAGGFGRVGTMTEFLRSGEVFTPSAPATPCTTGGECASTFCVDGFCCNSACTGQCEACDLSGKVGTCSAVTGAPRGGRAACVAAGPAPCEAKSCDGTNRTACQLVGGNPCGANSCSAGVERHVGTCSAGTCGDTPKSCGTYACGATACKTSCTTTADCTAGHYCMGSVCTPVVGLGTPCTDTSSCSSGLFCTDGVCCGSATCAAGSSCSTPTKKGTCAKIPGASCAIDAECGSGHCVDGVCCDTACGNQCEACDVVGKVGTCSPVSGAPHGARSACDDGAGDPCKARTCDGAADVTACTAYKNGAATTCGTASCSAASFTSAGRCDGKGGCTAGESTSCVPYRCTDAGCRTSCAADSDCAENFVCKDGKCAPKDTGATCSSDGTESIGKDGTRTLCAPYRCGGDGKCATECGGSEACAVGFVCEVASKLCVAAEPTAGDEGGCSTRPGRGGWSWIGLAFAAVAIGRGRRR